ncbi:ribosomal RNA adenine methyltransferase KsgA/Erm [Sporodiniella umbellata]|nr:ribosomal RNA adenine methyltransferase KsgA/Erm [Sporodiniella umbellata]
MLKIPKASEWTKNFKSKAGAVPRSVLASQETAIKASKTLKKYDFKNMTAVDLYPGLGTWTSALRDIGFKRVLALEPHAPYYNWVKTIESESGGVIELLKKDGYDWETYNILRDPKYLGNFQNDDWSQVHPNIFFTGFIPKGRKGEQLLSQFICCANTKMAMHSFGRVPMVFWVPDALHIKFTAGPGEKSRCKMSVVAEGCGDVETLYTTDETDIYPETKYHLVALTPRKETDWDVFEYVLKHLFVIRKQPLALMMK